VRLTVLGSGTCVPNGRRNSSGYWIDAGDAHIRLDCGAGTVHAMARDGLPWESLTHQIITHFHLDHVGELPMLLFSLRYGRSSPRSTPLSLIGPAGLSKLLTGLERVLSQKLIEQEFPVTIHELAPGATLDLADDVRLSVAKTPHTVESLAVRIDHAGHSIGYTGDTAPSDDLATFFHDVDLLVAECSFISDPKKTPHLTAPDVAALATAANARHLVATHCYFDPDTTRLADLLARGYSGRVSVAADGAIYEV
jgi:ribonuclease BN (tRNA processing enzyme)